MLPFLKPKRMAGVILSTYKSDGKLEPEEEQESQGLKSVAEDLIRAVHSKDADSVVGAIKAAFEMMDSEPHVEGPHIEE